MRARSMRSAWPVVIAGGAIGCLVALLADGPSAVQAQPTSQASPALPRGDDLALADGAGSVLVGLTVRPAQPGPNRLLVHVLPLAGPAAAADVPIRLLVDGQPVALEFCSRSCRRADVTLAGGEHIDIVADGPSGGTAGFEVPGLPAPDGGVLLEQLQDRMHRLRTFRMAETLTPAAVPLQTRYTFEAPDRMQMDISNGSHSIFVGSVRYTRNDRLPADWQGEDIGISLSVPSFVWDPRPSDSGFVAAHVLGVENVDGADAQVLTFFENLGQYPFWFRLWVDTDGLVRRAEMRGQGHFMDQQYTDFDAPLTIEPPT